MSISASDGGGHGPTGRAQKAVLVAAGREAMRVKLGAVERYDPRTAETVTEWVAEMAWWPAHLAPKRGGGERRRVSRRTTFATGATPADALEALANLIRVGWGALEAEIAGTGLAGS